MPWPINYAPEGWVFCDGRMLSVQQNQALFALLGTTYGGDGRNTFGMPDLRGRFPACVNNTQASNTIPVNALGATGGSATTELPMPAHNHGLSAAQAKSVLKVGTSAAGTQITPTAGASLAISPAGGSTAAQIYQTTAPTSTVDVNGVGTSLTGVTDTSAPAGPQDVTTPKSVVNPYVGVQYIIFTQGQFPVRD